MKQDMILILDLGSEENPRLAREIRAMGVYTEIHPHDISAAELAALPNAKGIILNGGVNRVVDGVEIVNACHSNPRSAAHNDPAYDARAIAYARGHGFPTTAGSDIHSTDLFGGGVAFRRRLKSGQDFCQAILSGEDYILTNGARWFDKQGNPLDE